MHLRYETEYSNQLHQLLGSVLKHFYVVNYPSLRSAKGKERTWALKKKARLSSPRFASKEVSGRGLPGGEVKSLLDDNITGSRNQELVFSFGWFLCKSCSPDWA
jgi:hypothetical protein